ncbi:hypothetical protein [Pseudactinotalea suaedae]|uniref:hypothetical protein n=1 Tax=Pseudactinotalea suaedae TaxID=1524924 RepID=UPI0012E18758|nr:hypothetical protein [Pseudactinotalea suaedae]
MKTLAVVGTAGGVGTTTVAALAFAGMRQHPHGGPMLYARPSARLIDRVGDDSVPALNGDLAIWDAGVHSPESAAALLEAGSCVLAVAAPATPLGIADAARVLSTVAELGEDALSGVAVVLSQVDGRGRPVPSPAIPSPMLVRIPYDATLAAAGPVPPVGRLSGRARTAAVAWQRRATALLAP